MLFVKFVEVPQELAHNSQYMPFAGGSPWIAYKYESEAGYDEQSNRGLHEE